MLSPWYEMSVKRNHPHQDAIHVAGWVSLFTLHVIWPFLWIWATLYREDRGWGMKPAQLAQDHAQLAQLEQRLAMLENHLAQQAAQKGLEQESAASEGKGV